MKRIGLLGGMSPESTALYYRYLNLFASEQRGGSHSAQILLWSFNFAEIEGYQSSGNWCAAENALARAAQRLEEAGADCIVICSNTMHKVAVAIEKAVCVPLIHAAEAVRNELVLRRLRKPLLLATRSTMEDGFFIDRLHGEFDVDICIPKESERVALQNIIYRELCFGKVSKNAKLDCLKIIARAEKAKIDSVVLGCTELGILINQSELDIPVIETTKLHSKAAIDFALASDSPQVTEKYYHLKSN